MKPPKSRAPFGLAALTAAFAVAASMLIYVPSHRAQTRRATRPNAPAPVKATARKSLTQDGVSITYDVSLAREIRAERAPAVLLEDESEKPDWVWPERTLFTLVGTGVDRGNDPYSEPAIHVCSVTGYEHAVSISADLTARLGKTLEELNAMLRQQPRAISANVPTLPFPDSTEAFHAHVKYLKFRNGTGVAYLTQAQQDESLVNNQQVSYEFRGLTDDGRHYIYASFPVTAPILAATRDAASHDAYRLPRSFYAKNRVMLLRSYRAYVNRTKARLERLPPDSFTPSLRLLDEMLASLEIDK